MSRPATWSVDGFLRVAYDSVAETMPDEYTTFNHVYKERWQDILRFRSRSLFTTCEVCCSFKTQLQDRKLSFEQKLGCLQGYRAHLHDQYCDRTSIWTLQFEGADPQSGILMICTDGLDQAKFALPRDPQLRANAGLAKHQRPRMKIHGVWCYGYTLNISVMDECSRHDSSAILEMISRAVEDATWVSFCTGFLQFIYVVKADNTVREAKNQHVLTYLHLAVGRHLFRSACLCHLRKSHTHCRVGHSAVFGVTLSC
ncbi:unnamed protein product [Durusdinium trenchii]|uniref:DUF7869 domain-containing protein n=1 Tax=Durusdinium trenchii TaxID=1381693 RepID=A0ABP0IVI7_9DINO